MSRRRKPNFNITFKDYSKNETLCLLSLSDAWSRRAEFDRPELAAEFNKRAKEFCSAAQYYDFSTVEKWPMEKMQRAFDNMVETAQEQGIERIILPIYNRSPIGRFVRKNILNEYNGEVKVELQNSSYTSRLKHLGGVDGRRKTAFQYGLAKVAQ